MTVPLLVAGLAADRWQAARERTAAVDALLAAGADPERVRRALGRGEAGASPRR